MGFNNKLHVFRQNKHRQDIKYKEIHNFQVLSNNVNSTENRSELITLNLSWCHHTCPLLYVLKKNEQANLDHQLIDKVSVFKNKLPIRKRSLKGNVEKSFNFQI